MKKILFLLFFLAINNIVSQKKDSITCNNDKSKAFINFKNGNGIVGYRLEQFETLTKDKEDFIFFKKVFYATNHHINYHTILPFSCFYKSPTLEEKKCDSIYKTTLDSLIIQNFGIDFIKKSEIEIEKIYKIFKTTQKNQQYKFIDTTLVYNFAESTPKFNGNDRILYNHLTKFVTTNFKENQLKNIGLKMEYSENGKILNCYFTDFIDNDFYAPDYYTIPNIYTKKYNKLGTWVPAYLYYSKIKFSSDYMSLKSYTEMGDW